jgi:aspartate racemase
MSQVTTSMSSSATRAVRPRGTMSLLVAPPSTDAEGGPCLRRLGIVGGVGPRASADLYLRIVGTMRGVSDGAIPEIVMHSLPITPGLERSFATGCFGPEEERHIRRLLAESAVLLRDAGVDVIALPCNTLHDYFPEFLDELGIPFVDMIIATCESLQRRGSRRALLLATRATVTSGTYARAAARLGVELLVPGDADQLQIGDAITDLLARPHGPVAARMLISQLAADLPAGIDTVVIGCTDLSSCVPTDLPVPVVDSLACLAEATSRSLIAPHASIGSPASSETRGA